MSSHQVKLPSVAWVNSGPFIKVKIFVSRATNVKIKFADRGLAFESGSKDISDQVCGFAATYELFDTIDPSLCSFRVLGSYIDVTLQKTTSEEWSRFTRVATSHPAIRVDWDRAEYEPEEFATAPTSPSDQRKLMEQQRELIKKLSNESADLGQDLKKTYLAIYYMMMSFGWLVCFGMLLSDWADMSWNWGAFCAVAWTKVGHFVQILQILTGLEIFHLLTGLVSGDLLQSVLRHLDRDTVLFGVLSVAPAIASVSNGVVSAVSSAASEAASASVSVSWALVVALLGWTALETVHWTRCAACVWDVDAAPPMLERARVTLPLVVYPLVAAAELHVHWLSLTALGSPLFADFNVAALWPILARALMVVHVLIAPFLWWRTCYPPRTLRVSGGGGKKKK